MTINPSALQAAQDCNCCWCGKTLRDSPTIIHEDGHAAHGGDCAGFLKATLPNGYEREPPDALLCSCPKRWARRSRTLPIAKAIEKDPGVDYIVLPVRVQKALVGNAQAVDHRMKTDPSRPGVQIHDRWGATRLRCRVPGMEGTLYLDVELEPDEFSRIWKKAGGPELEFLC